MPRKESYPPISRLRFCNEISPWNCFIFEINLSDKNHLMKFASKIWLHLLRPLDIDWFRSIESFPVPTITSPFSLGLGYSLFLPNAVKWLAISMESAPYVGVVIRFFFLWNNFSVTFWLNMKIFGPTLTCYKHYPSLRAMVKKIPTFGIQRILEMIFFNRNSRSPCSFCSFHFSAFSHLHAEPAPSFVNIISSSRVS